MRPSTRAVSTCLLLSALLVSSAGIARAEWPHSPLSPKVLYPSGGAAQHVYAALPDGSGGAYLVFADNASGVSLLATHMLATGDRDPAFGLFPAILQSLPNTASDVSAVLDGSGGFYVVWRDDRTGVQRNYFIHVLSSGVFAAGFSTNGLPLTTAVQSQDPASLAVDPDGSLYAAWSFDFSVTDKDIMLGKYSPTGTVLALITATGGTLSETKPEIMVDPDLNYSAVDLVHLVPSGTVYRTYSRTNLVPKNAITINASGASPDTRPQLANDGLGSTIVLYTEAVIGQYALGMQVVRDGAMILATGTFSGGAAGTLDVSDLVYCGEGRVWLAYRWSGVGQLLMRYLTASGAGGPVFAMPGAGFKFSNLLASDGSGGAIALAGEFVTGGERALATKRDLIDNRPAYWGAEQLAMQTQQFTLVSAMCSDGNGGVYVFGHEKTGSVQKAVATHIDRWGTFDAAPVITSVKDVTGDQGGLVRVSWKASYLDDAARAQISSYRVWRQVPQSALASARSRVLYDPASGNEPEPGTLWVPERGTAVASSFAWEFVSTTPAAQLPLYSATVPTSADSSASSAADTYFMIESRGVSFNVGWSSLEALGYSVDNLSPATPTPFAGAVVGGASTQLTWGANSESDLAGYELYRGASAGFVPSALNRIATPTATNFLDSSAGQYYKLAAIDSHGNRSGFALLTPTGVLDAGDTAPRELSFTLASANPAMGSATLRYALPGAARVRVQLLDVNGRIVRTLLDASVAAGTYSARWDGHDASGARSAAGMYFARLTAGGRTLTRRIVLAE